MSKKIVLIAASLVIAIFGYIGYSKIFNKPKEVLKTATAKVATLKISFAVDGMTAIERRDLKFNVSGKVARINVKEGQEVKKGQLLMSLDAQDVAKNLERDLKDYQIARNTFDETSQVTYPDGALTDTIKRLLQNTQSTLDKSVLDVEIRNESLKESRLYSPITGVVSAINIKEGEIVSTQSTSIVATVTVPNSLVFEAYAEDTDVLKIDLEQKTQIEIDALPNITFPAEILHISNLATIDANGLASYKIKANMSDLRNYKILDGMAGQLEFVTKEKSGILVVPNAAITRKENKSYVQKIVDGNTEETQVETGFTDGKDVEIINGLSNGDIVVIP